MPEEQVIAKGLVEKIGLDGSRIKHKTDGGKQVVIEESIQDHQSGMEMVLEILLSEENGCLKDLTEIDAVGHRVVHGGEDFSGSVPLTDEVIKALEDNIELAPLHNPPNLEGIYTMKKLLPDVPPPPPAPTVTVRADPETTDNPAAVIKPPPPPPPPPRL